MKPNLLVPRIDLSTAQTSTDDCAGGSMTERLMLQAETRAVGAHCATLVSHTHCAMSVSGAKLCSDKGEGCIIWVSWCTDSRVELGIGGYSCPLALEALLDNPTFVKEVDRRGLTIANVIT